MKGYQPSNKGERKKVRTKKHGNQKTKWQE